MTTRAKSKSISRRAPLNHIAPGLRKLARSIDELTLDPKNAREHTPENIATIKASLQEYGQQKPIVLDADGKTVIAGNGTLVAARELEWAHVAAVTTDLDALKAAGFAIADNRASDLAGWKEEVLMGTLELLQKKQAPIIGFTEEQLKGLLEDPDIIVPASLDAPSVPRPNECPKCGYRW